ncbi:MAG TPA: PEP-CTERM sorting domain-containing protein [Verrucomicrobiae bacterium]|jgi:hypothetical protein
MNLTGADFPASLITIMGSQLTPILRRIKLSLVWLVVLTLSAVTVTAQTTAYVVPAGLVGNQDLSLAPQSLGMDFNVNASIFISSLGVFDSGQNGLTAPLTAHIFDRVSQNSLVALTFSPAVPGALIGGSRFLPLAVPLLLVAGFNGSIVVDYVTNPTELNGNQNDASFPHPWTTDSGGGLISFVGLSRHTLGGTGAGYPNIVDAVSADKYAAGTFQFVAIPEPSILGLLALGGLLSVRLFRRRSL